VRRPSKVGAGQFAVNARGTPQRVRRGHSRCHRTTVSAWTNIKALRQSCQVLANRTRNSRSRVRRRGRLTLRCKARSCCRSAMFFRGPVPDARDRPTSRRAPPIRSSPARSYGVAWRGTTAIYVITTSISLSHNGTTGSDSQLVGYAASWSTAQSRATCEGGGHEQRTICAIYGVVSWCYARNVRAFDVA
jgi:hypothetical protein